jgi:cytoskeletal protein CcmA (bactofilin family)
MEKGKSDNSTSLLSQNVKIEGDIQGEENLHVEGQFKGSIKLSGDIYIGNTGVVEADIEANSVVIQGNVTGNIIAHKQLEIQPTGRLIGDCTAQSIDIKEGAIFEGRSQMLKSASVSTGPAARSGSGEKPTAKDQTKK